MQSSDKPERREFIPQLRDYIVNQCAAFMTEAQCLEAIDKWSSGQEAATVWERGVFSVCDDHARNLDKMGGESDGE